MPTPARRTLEVAKEAGPLVNVIAVLSLIVIMLAERSNGMSTAGSGSTPSPIVQIQLDEIARKLDKIDEKLDPLRQEVTALKIRVGALEQAIGRSQEDRP